MRFDSIVVVNHSADNSILDLAVMQVHANFFADLEIVDRPASLGLAREGMYHDGDALNGCTGLAR